MELLYYVNNGIRLYVNMSNNINGLYKPSTEFEEGESETGQVKKEEIAKI